MSSGTGPPLDADAVVRALDSHRVSYLIVGGLAAQLHGLTRTPRDFDLAPRWRPENLEQLKRALVTLRAEPYEPSDAACSDTQAHFWRLLLGRWRTSAGVIDVLFGMPGGFHELSRRATECSLHGVTVRLASLPDVVTAKQRLERSNASGLEALWEGSDVERGRSTVTYAKVKSDDGGEHRG
jgi:hypothetical protein